MAAQCELVQLPVGSVCGKWTILKKLGEGAFGAVYLVRGKESMEQDIEYALKVEAETDPLGLLKMEVLVMMEVKKQKMTPSRHFLELADRGNVPNKFNYIVMTLVGKSLQSLRETAKNNKFTFGTAISVGRQCLEAIEDLHSLGFLHRDIKPGNFTIGRMEPKDELRKVCTVELRCTGMYFRCTCWTLEWLAGSLVTMELCAIRELVLDSVEPSSTPHSPATSRESSAGRTTSRAGCT